MVDTTGFNARDVEEFRANHGQLGGGFAGAPVLLVHTVGARVALIPTGGGARPTDRTERTSS